MDSLPDFISRLPVWSQYTIGVLVLLATIGLPVSKIISPMWRWPMHKLWPRRQEWGAECIPPLPTEPIDDERIDPNRAWKLGPAERWTQMREMRKGDYYQLHINKPRVIKRIEAISKEYRYPLKYKLKIQENDNQNWTEVGEYDGPIDVSFDKPRKLVALEFVITEPRLEPKTVIGKSPAWSIYDIRLTEVRLFGKFWKRVIER